MRMQCAGVQRCGGQQARSSGAHSKQRSLLCWQEHSLVPPPRTQESAPHRGIRSWQRRRRRRQQAVQAHYGGAGALGPPLNGQLLRVIAASGISGAGREEVGKTTGPRIVGSTPAGDPLYLEFPSRAEQESQAQPGEPPLIRVRLSVHYRVHSRQMLCIGGSQIPFGWSFLSIAKVPMQWSEGDIWIADVDLPAGSRVEYKYVIMEEQDWTSQVSEDAEGIVSFSYRTQPDDPPDVQTIQKQMAIVAWQPGPNRVVQVPDLEEVRSLKAGEVREREPARSLQQQPQQQQRSGRQYGQQAFGQGLRSQPAASAGSASGKDAEETDPLAGTWETLSRTDGGSIVERRDVWGLPDPVPRVNPLEGLRFDS